MAKPKQIPEKCLKCAPLSAADARAKHPHCWDDSTCHSKRSYIRNRDRINQKRSRKHIETKYQIPLPQAKYGVLLVWRESREDSPIHALGADLYEGDKKLPFIETVHCAGWPPSWVYDYLDKALLLLKAECGSKTFAAQVVIAPDRCPIRPCYLCQQ